MNSKISIDDMFAISDGYHKEEKVYRGLETEFEQFETGEINEDISPKESIITNYEPSSIHLDARKEETEQKPKKKGLFSRFKREKKKEIIKEIPKEEPVVFQKKEEFIPKEESYFEPEYDKTQLLDEEEQVNLSSSFILLDLETGRTTYINKPSFLIGCRSGLCDLVIEEDPKNHKVSRKHALLFVKNDTVYVKDMSANGTFLGDEKTSDSDYYRLPKDTEVEIRKGQIIRFANKKFKLLCS